MPVSESSRTYRDPAGYDMEVVQRSSPAAGYFNKGVPVLRARLNTRSHLAELSGAGDTQVNTAGIQQIVPYSTLPRNFLVGAPSSRVRLNISFRTYRTIGYGKYSGKRHRYKTNQTLLDTASECPLWRQLKVRRKYGQLTLS